MSLSRSPSPVPGGGWASPGLNINSSGRSSPVPGYSASNGTPVIWESARQKTMGAAGGYPSFSTHNQGFFTRHMRRLSSSLPRFGSSTHYAEKEKLGRGRWPGQNVPLLGRLRGVMARMGRKMKLRLLVIFLLIISIITFFNTRPLLSPPSPGMGRLAPQANTPVFQH
jgi:mannan polymerase II complex MNN10 subunit